MLQSDSDIACDPDNSKTLCLNGCILVSAVVSVCLAYSTTVPCAMVRTVPIPVSEASVVRKKVSVRLRDSKARCCSSSHLKVAPIPVKSMSDCAMSAN